MKNFNIYEIIKEEYLINSKVRRETNQKELNICHIIELMNQDLSPYKVLRQTRDYIWFNERINN